MIELRSAGCETTSAEWEGNAGVCVDVDFPELTVQRLSHGELDRFDLPVRHELFDERVARLVLDLAAEAMGGRPNGSLYSEGLSLCLLSLLVESHGQPRRHRHERVLSTRQAKRLVEFIDLNLCGDLRVQRLANEMGMSPFALSKHFSATFSQSLHQYVVRRRIDKATEALVANRTESIGQIALAHGFSSHAHFTSTYRKLFGGTPGELRSDQI